MSANCHVCNRPFTDEQPARAWAGPTKQVDDVIISELAFHHDDEARPTCYEKWQWNAEAYPGQYLS